MSSEITITKIQEFIYELKVEQVMATDVVSVRPDLPMDCLRAILREKRISGVPVVRSGAVVGLVSIEDFIKWLVDGSPDGQVAGRMSCDVVTVCADEPIAEAIRMFEKFRFGRLPVVERESRSLVGMLTKSDIVRGLLSKVQSGYMEEEIHTYRASHIFEDMVADEMSLSFSYEIQGKQFERAGGCATGLKRNLRRLGVTPVTLRRVSIATYEAEMNIIIHATSGTITAQVFPGEIRIRAVDVGPGIADIEQAMRPGYSTTPDWIRELGFGAGMGLENIRRCSDSLNLTSVVGEGTVLSAAILLNGKGGVG